MSTQDDITQATTRLNEAATKANTTTDFFDNVLTGSENQSFTNPNNGKSAPSVKKATYDRTDELFSAAESDINQAVTDAQSAAGEAQVYAANAQYVEERVLGVGVSIYRGTGVSAQGNYVQNGDTVTAGATHLAVLINGKPEDVAMSPIASGLVSNLTETGATIGGVPVEFQPIDYSAPLKRITDRSILSGRAVEGQRISWLGYYEPSDGGSNWGVIKKGAHIEDGGSILSIDANTYIEANLKGKTIAAKKFGTVNDGVADDQPFYQAAVNAAKERQVVSTKNQEKLHLLSGVVVNKRLILDFGDTEITHDMTSGTLFRLTSRGIEITGGTYLGLGATDNVRCMWFDGANDATLKSVSVGRFKEGLWFDNGSYGSGLKNVQVNQCRGRGIYVDTDTSAEAEWNDVYVGLSESYIDASTTGIELFAATAVDTGGFSWVNVLVVNNYAAGARAGKGIYLNGGAAGGNSPVQMTGGGVDGFKKSLTTVNHNALYIRNWSQFKAANTWFADVLINDCDSVQFLGGYAALGFKLIGQIRKSVFSYVRCTEALNPTNYAFDIDPSATFPEGFFENGTQFNGQISNDMAKWFEIKRGGLTYPGTVYTNSSSSLDAIKYKDFDATTSPANKVFYQRINSVGELVWMKDDFIDHTILKQNGVMNVPGGYTPFTGIHIGRSNDAIVKGLAVDIVGILRESVTQDLPTDIDSEPFSYENAIPKVEVTKSAKSKVCAGVVDQCVERADGAFDVYIAAVGDNSTQNLLGFLVCDEGGDIHAGDILCTASTPGYLMKIPEGEQESVCRFKAMESAEFIDGKAIVYGYFK